MFEIKELEYCKSQVSYTASAQEIAEKEEEVLNVFKKAPVPKFRKGKADLKVIKHFYKDQINESLKRALTEFAYHKFLFDHEVQVYGQPQLLKSLLLGKSFQTEFVVHVLPKFELGQYKNLDVVVKTPDSTVEDLVQNMLQNLRVKHGDKNPYSEDSVVCTGDQLLISYTGFVDGVEQPQLTANSESMVVGKSSLPAFDEQLVGMRVGETKMFECAIPSEGFQAFADKKITFSVTLHSGTHVQPCPLDNTLADRMNKDSLEQLKSELLTVASNQIEQQQKQLVLQQLQAQMVNSHQFEVPVFMVQAEAEYLAKSAKLDWATLTDDTRVRYMKLATDNVKLSLILRKVRDVEPEAQLSDEECFNIIKSHFSTLTSPENLMQVLNNLNQMNVLETMAVKVRDEFTLDFCLKNSNFVS